MQIPCLFRTHADKGAPGPQPPLTDLKVKMTIEKEKNSRGIQTQIPCISPFRVGE